MKQRQIVDEQEVIKKGKLLERDYWILGLVSLCVVATVLLLPYAIRSPSLHTSVPTGGHPPPPQRIDIKQVRFDNANPNTLLINVKWRETNPADLTIVFDGVD